MKNINFSQKQNELSTLAHCKDTTFEAQKKIVYKAFFDSPKSMLMVSIETGILRANICRYVSEWKKQDSIIEAYRARCVISKRIATFYTTSI